MGNHGCTQLGQAALLTESNQRSTRQGHMSFATCCVTLGKWLNLSVPRFPPL